MGADHAIAPRRPANAQIFHVRLRRDPQARAQLPLALAHPALQQRRRVTHGQNAPRSVQAPRLTQRLPAAALAEKSLGNRNH